MDANVPFDVSEGHSLLLSLQDQDRPQAYDLDVTEDSILLNPPGLSSSSPSASRCFVPVSLLETPATSPVSHFTTPGPPAAFLAPARSPFSSATGPLQSPFADPPPRDVEAELRATVDSLLKRKKEAQRGLIDENNGLREEVAFLRNTLRLSAAESTDEHAAESNRTELAAALAQERADRLRSEEKLRAVVEYLAEQVASLSTRRATVEQALLTSESDCEAWRHKTNTAVLQCEFLETENLKVKSLLSVLARQAPSAVQQQVQGMLREVARDRANLKKLEQADRLVESSSPRLDVKGIAKYDTQGFRKAEDHLNKCTTEYVMRDLSYSG
ncbi:hypothetical protein C8Q79DRAFT_925645 [Trametes meyenii]|nr:hypothetical protein C8Q79DRAFT_925645 [Trametes meyenii]